ncbi:PAS domain S-box protein [bacterium]|nr:PAS domain S-box protein [bacterium]
MMTVLIAGVEQQGLAFLQSCLKGDGYHVVQSPPDELSAAVIEWAPRVILFGLDSIDRAGLGYAEEILWEHNVPLLFLGHNTKNPLYTQALALSHYGLLVAPYSKEQLLASIQTALQFQASESCYKNIVESQPELICRFRPDGTLLFVNKAYCQYFQRDWEELIGQKFLPLVPEEDQAQLRQHFSGFCPTRPVQTHEHRVITPDGRIIWQQWTDRAFFNDQGEVIEFQSIGHDVTERKTTEITLRESLHEKELLLRELHHRVKNNLQIIISLLNIQSRVFQDQDLVDQFSKIQQRIYSMSLIHDKLCSAEDLSRIDLATYIKSLCQYLHRTYGSEQVTIQLDLTSVQLPIDQAVPCGLIINELVTNSLKHAFPVSESGTIAIGLHCTEDENMILKVQDNGRGLPSDYRDKKTMGINLIEMLVGQMHGTITFLTDPDPVIAITIALKHDPDEW